MKYFILSLTFIALSLNAQASCIDTIESIQKIMGTSAGSSKIGTVDIFESQNNLLKETVSISKDLVRGSYGRPIASSSVRQINGALENVLGGYTSATPNFKLAGFLIKRLKEECVDK